MEKTRPELVELARSDTGTRVSWQYGQWRQWAEWKARNGYGDDEGWDALDGNERSRLVTAVAASTMPRQHVGRIVEACAKASRSEDEFIRRVRREGFSIDPRLRRGTAKDSFTDPGQVVGYLLLDLHRRQLKVREMVNLLEQAIIDCIADYGLDARRKDGAPGVYIDGAKVAALGLRVKNGCSYHGLSLNVDMDLTPFTWINPCGYSGLQTIQLKDFGVTEGPEEVATRLLGHLQRHFPDVPPT